MLNFFKEGEKLFYKSPANYSQPSSFRNLPATFLREVNPSPRVEGNEVPCGWIRIERKKPYFLEVRLSDLSLKPFPKQ